jgi:hypothetical protein
MPKFIICVFFVQFFYFPTLLFSSFINSHFLLINCILHFFSGQLNSICFTCSFHMHRRHIFFQLKWIELEWIHILWRQNSNHMFVLVWCVLSAEQPCSTWHSVIRLQLRKLQMSNPESTIHQRFTPTPLLSRNKITLNCLIFFPNVFGAPPQRLPMRWLCVPENS